MKRLHDVIGDAYHTIVVKQADPEAAIQKFCLHACDDGFMSAARQELARVERIDPRRCHISHVTAQFLKKAIDRAGSPSSQAKGLM